MSYNLVLKDSKHNWARGACCSPISATARLTAASTAAAPKPPTLAELNLTPDEKKKLAGVAAIKKASQSGDKHAQRQWKKAPRSSRSSRPRQPKAIRRPSAASRS